VYTLRRTEHRIDYYTLEASRRPSISWHPLEQAQQS
jgi:hypothetical protein